MADAQVVEWIRGKYLAIVSDLDERARRRWAAAEALAGMGWRDRRRRGNWNL